tara:strand:+ start:5856 stop:7280 length:1425 start_codon:yes stop_codon:yes gene_type:complete
MKKNIYIFLIFYIFSFLLGQNQEMYRIEAWQDEFFSYLRKTSESRGINKEVYIKRLLNDVQNYLSGEDLTIDEEVFLSVWEIKALFYNGDIEESINKKNQFEVKVNSREFNVIYSLPNFLYLDDPELVLKNTKLSYNPNKCLANKLHSLNPTKYASWNLEILDTKEFNKNFLNLYMVIGKNNDFGSIEIDEHKESILIRNKQNYQKVTYSIFPPLTDYDKDDEKPNLESTDRDDILKFENELSKKMKIQKIRNNHKKHPIIFNHKTKELGNRFTCKISNLPIFKIRGGGQDDYYKLYIHDSEVTSRYTFLLNKFKTIDDKTLLLSWNDERWVMQEDFNENLVTISIPGQPGVEGKEWFSNSFKFSIGNENPLSINEFSKDDRVNLRRSSTDYEDISNTTDDDSKWDLKTENFDLSDSLLVQRLEIELDSTSNNTLNVEVSNNYSSYNDDKKDLNRVRLTFYASLIIAISALIFF